MRSIWHFILATMISFSSLAYAEKPTVLFEGYSKILSAGVHVGYAVGRYEFNPTTKTFKATTFLRTGQLGADVMESLQAESDEKFGPISYHYTSVVGKAVKTIDAKFNRSKLKTAKGVAPKYKIQMVATVNDAGKMKTIKKDLDEGTFLSSFLVYLMLQSKQGLQTNANYNYKAIAEEDASVEAGSARVDKQEKYNGLDTFKITNTFKNVSFTSYITDRGETIATRSPALSISTELVAKSSEAVGTLGLNSGVLKTLFGGVPEGLENILSKRMVTDSKPIEVPAEPSKKQGVPQGQGIQLKSGGSVTSPNPSTDKKDQ